MLLALLLVGRLTLAERPVAGLGAAYVAGAGLLGLLAAWTLLSALWSDATARAFVEFDRTLVYLLAFVLLGMLGRTESRVRWLVRGLVLAAFGVCLCGLITRVLPDVWTLPAEVANDRLAYPLTYRNALGILAAIGLILGFGLSADAREHPVARVLGAAALPVLATTLLFTFSRGSMAAGAAGVVVAIVAMRSMSVLSALVAAIPVAIAVRAAYAAELLTGDEPTTAAATAEGHDLALVIALCCAGAAVLRVLMLLLDRGAARVAVPAPLRQPVVKVAAVLVLVGAAAGAAFATGAVDALERQYDRSVKSDQVEDTGDRRERLTDPGNGGRLSQWRVALRESRGERLHGTGAGTYALLWDRGRGEEYGPETVYQVEDAHSLYVEMLAELGIVGLALLVGVLLLILAACAWRARGPGRGPYAALLGAMVAWSLHAAVDWDWEMPAVTAWLFAAGGLVLAAAAGRPDEPKGEGDATGRHAGGTPRLLRVVAALGVLLIAVIPARVFLSEGPLRDAQDAFAAGDCPRAVDRGLDSVAFLSVRPEPFAIVGYCDVRLQSPELAVAALENAVRRDPGNWEFHYGLAIVRGAAGKDPRPAARRARELNPMSRLARETAQDLDVEDPIKWRRRALAARLPRD